DFGATSATIRRVKTGEDQAKHALDQVRQQLLLEGSTAYLNLLRTSEVLGFARQSEENIRKQTGLEEARVQRGSGLTTDVLQAKTQLAGAQARRSRAEGALEVARNRYSTVFGETPASLAGPRPTISFDRAPGNLDDAVKLALDNNPQLKAAQAGAMGARENVKATQAKAFAPRLDGKASATYKHDVDGTMNKERSLLYKVELSFPFNLAFTAINTLEIAKSGLSATEARVADARNTVEEQVRNAWQNLRSARETADFLRNQATIAGEFLELARRERQLGTRSLIDILNGETALINANADAASAETDVLIGQLSLLAAMGQLDFAAIR
ncbi:MAG: outer membrane efflux protein, partial [Alphaproteobacteria bacterium]|nr:outer membrane efflux protein [Alphaproteobacteria bacterium]